jgi:hypothetical protein
VSNSALSETALGNFAAAKVLSSIVKAQGRFRFLKGAMADAGWRVRFADAVVFCPILERYSATRVSG